MSATIYTEQEANRPWRLSPDYAGPPLHQQLLRNEFLGPAAHQANETRLLRRMLEHCYDVVPYYRELFQRQGIHRRHLRDTGILRQIPSLEKAAVESRARELRAPHLLTGQRRLGITRTSGTTGQPTIVEHSDISMGMFRWLKQREFRWLRYDPSASFLSIRPSIENPTLEDGSYLSDGNAMQLPCWPWFQDLFATGPAWAFNNTNPVAKQAELLAQVQPNYLLMQASCLEYLSLQELDTRALAGLRGVQAISQTLTPAMRAQIEEALGIPVSQNYGLNEIGLVASRCAEGGRYHVHNEHCLVEIVDDNGNPCEPGTTGRLLVTTLSNSAMPLLRYDADDLAEVVDGPCPCGRTLPSFGAVQGRYRRSAYLPEGTFQRWAAIQLNLYRLAARNPAAVRRYQAYQDAGGDFELRIDCNQEVLDGIDAALRQEFAAAYPDTTTPDLTILRTDEFIGAGERKFQNFVSEFTPEMDR